MRRFLIVFTLLCFAPAVFGQSGSCLIVKHKGTVGRRMIWFALIGVPIAPGASYDYVDAVGYTPDKMSYKGKELQRLGVRVIILEKPTGESILAARQSCSPVTVAPTLTQVSAPKTIVSPQSSTQVAPEGPTPVRQPEQSLGDYAREHRVKETMIPPKM